MADSGRRNLKGSLGAIVSVVAVSAAVFHLAVAGLLIFVDPAEFLSYHLLVVLVLVPLLYPALRARKRDGITVVDVLLAAGGIVTGIYASRELMQIAERGAVMMTPVDMAVGICVIVLVLVASRRTVGLALPLLALAFLAYALTRFKLERVVAAVFSVNGIYGTALSVTASWIFIFLLFGNVLSKTKVGDFFMKVSVGLAGKSVGGPAKVATLASALFGSISGSAVANVAGTGVFTIPMMKKLGFRPAVAGAVEAVASTGGQVMPPLMGAGAFIMAELLGIPYLRVCAASLIPAVLYFLALWLSIDAYAKRFGLKGLPPQDLPSLRRVLKEEGYLAVPLVLFIFLLVVLKMSALTAALCSTGASVLLGVADTLRKKGSLTLMEGILMLRDAMYDLLPMASAAACAGIVIGVINLTGVGLKFGNALVTVGHGSQLLSLVMAMVAAIIFGMGLPTTVSYLLCAAVICPSLISLGISALKAHLFVFYFACFSAITPPVAMAVYTGATIAGASFWETARYAVQLGAGGVLVAFLFVVSDGLLMMSGPVNIFIDTLMACGMLIGVVAALGGFLLRKCSVLERAVLLCFSLIIAFGRYTGSIWPGVLGIAVTAAFLITQIVQHMTHKKMQSPLDS